MSRRIDRLAAGALADGLLVEIDLHGAGQAIGDHQGRRRQVVGPHLGVDAALEVAVARKDGGHDEIVVHHAAVDPRVQRTAVADAGRAAKADQLVAEAVEVRGEASQVEVARHDARAGGQARLDVLRHAEARLDRLARQQPRGHHHGRVRRVRAARDGRNHDGAVAQLDLAAVEAKARLSDAVLAVGGHELGKVAPGLGQVQQVLRPLGTGHSRPYSADVQIDHRVEARLGRPRARGRAPGPCSTSPRGRRNPQCAP